MSYSTSESQVRGCKRALWAVSIPKSPPVMEFMEASEEQAYELCSPDRCDKHSEEIWKVRGVVEGKEQKKEAS